MRGICTWMGKGRSRSQAGFTLLEAVVSVALISTVILALSGGLLASVKSSQAAKSTQEIDAALSAYSETLKATPAATCPTTTTTSVPGYTNEITIVESWEVGASPPWRACINSDESYRMTVTVTEDADPSNSVTGQVVVGKP